eukprot:1138961-Pelagomonas_calceolata.AAC.2
MQARLCCKHLVASKARKINTRCALCAAPGKENDSVAMQKRSAACCVLRPPLTMCLSECRSTAS